MVRKHLQLLLVGSCGRKIREREEIKREDKEQRQCVCVIIRFKYY